jgi:hypothetical protein
MELCGEDTEKSADTGSGNSLDIYYYVVDIEIMHII